MLTKHWWGQGQLVGIIEAVRHGHQSILGADQLQLLRLHEIQQGPTIGAWHWRYLDNEVAIIGSQIYLLFTSLKDSWLSADMWEERREDCPDNDI